MTNWKLKMQADSLITFLRQHQQIDHEETVDELMTYMDCEYTEDELEEHLGSLAAEHKDDIEKLEDDHQDAIDRMQDEVDEAEEQLEDLNKVVDKLERVSP